MSLTVKQGPWHAMPTVWIAMFPKLGHDLDRITALFLDEKDLRVLEVCKSWRDNPCLIALQDRSVVEWRKDQAAMAAGWHPLLIRTFRRHHISPWDIPEHRCYGIRGKKYMPKIDGMSCSIAQYRLGGVGLVFALQTKNYHSEGPYTIAVRNLSANEVTLESSDVNVSTMTRLDAARFIDCILSGTSQEICLPNRVMQVLPKDSREIPWNIPSAPPRSQPQSGCLLRIARRIADCFFCCRKRTKLA